MYHLGCAENCYKPGGNSRDTTHVTLEFLREELIYDIRNNAYIEGHVWGEENRHAKHTLIEIGEEGNIDRVNRILGVAHANAVEMLHPYTRQDPVANEVINDKIWTPEKYRIEMNVPVTMSRTTLHLLCRLIHEFMVARVIHDWLSITHPEAASNWQVKADEAVEEINSIKHSRTGVLRRPSHPL